MFKPTSIVLILFGLWAEAQEPVISPPLRIDPSTAEGRWAAEYTAIAHGPYLAAMWMKEPALQAIGARRLFSSDYGTTFAIEDAHRVHFVVGQFPVQFAVPAGSDADHFIRGIPAIYNDGLNLRDFVDSNGRIDVRLEMTRPLDETIGLTSHYDFVQVVVVDN